MTDHGVLISGHHLNDDDLDSLSSSLEALGYEVTIDQNESLVASAADNLAMVLVLADTVGKRALDELVGVVFEWIRGRFKNRPGPATRTVPIYGPDDKLLKTIEVPIDPEP